MNHTTGQQCHPWPLPPPGETGHRDQQGLTLQERVQSEMRARRISASQLSRESGRPVSTIYTWLQQPQRLSISEELAAILNCDIVLVPRDAG